MDLRRQTAWALIVSIALSGAFLVPVCFAPSAFAADKVGEIIGIPSTGEVGVPRTVSEVMQIQASTTARTIIKDMEEEIEQPDRSGLPQNPASPDAAGFPELPAGYTLRPGGGEPFTPQVVGTNFTAATVLGVNPTNATPPDCMGAVGPTQYVVFVNGRLVTFNKTTGVADGVLNVTSNVFFAAVRNGSGTSDPRIRYDRLTGRWFLVIINVSTPNRILLAVSDAASNGVISGGTVFTYFFINIATTPPAISNTCLADYPTLGIDANALYTGTNNFCGTPTQTFNSTDGYVIRKSSVLGAGPIVVTAFRGLAPTAAAAGPYTPQGVDNYDPAATEGYFIGVDNATFGTLMMRRVSDPGGTPTISANIPVTVTATFSPVPVPHLGNTGGNNGRLDPLDDRLFAAHIRGGRLWTAHNIGVNNTGVSAGTVTRNGSRWYELDVPAGAGTPTVVESGTVFTASGTNLTDQRNYWVPSIMVSGQGHAALGFSVAGSAERVNAATVGRLSGDAAGTMRTPELVTASSTAYNPSFDSGATRGTRRWGDYSYTSVDPVDDQTLWTVQEFCDATDSYGVRVTKLIAPPPATPSLLADITAGSNPVTVTLTGAAVSGSGFFDPGANLPGVTAFNHLAVTISNGAATGTPPTIVSATYVSPTTVNLVLNAVAATANAGAEKYTLTVTNPDGQSVGAAVVHVVAPPLPAATIAAGPSQNEGDTATSAFNFTVNLSAAAGASGVTINYATSDDLATTADNDYLGATSFINIPPGQTSGTIAVTANGDAKFEVNETFGVTLTGAVNATLGITVDATGTIQNDDTAPTVSIENVTQAEGNSGTSAFVFTVSLSQASGLPASVQFSSADGSATLVNNDYQAASGTVNFAAGITSQPDTVLVNGDVTLEADETFTVTLVSPSGATIGVGTGTGTIQNDDGVPVLSIDSVTMLEGNAGTTAQVFTVTLSNPTDQAVAVDYQTADATATVADNDYQAASGTLGLPASTSSGTITVLVNGDLCGEPDENFLVNLSHPVGAVIGVGAGTGTGTIRNDDDITSPTVTVTFPNGGDSLAVGSTANIQWNATDDVAVTTVDICLSRDGGATYPEVLASGIANGGSFNWIVTAPNSAGADALVQVKAHDAGCNTGTDVSDAGAYIVTPSATAATTPGPITKFALGAIRPNPTQGATRIGFQLPREASVRIGIIDLQGREVAVVADRTFPAGRHEASWNGQTSRGPATMGVYFVHFEAGGRSFTSRLVLAR